MSHLDEGTLLALRDGSPLDDALGAEAHLQECPECREALEAWRGSAIRVEAALSTLDDSFDTDAARARVRALVAESAGHRADAPTLPSHRRVRGPWSRHLARAAGILLFAAVGVYALPGSPVRSWVSGILPGGDQSPTAPTSEPEREVPDASGVRVTVTAPVQVTILGLGAGGELTVAWVPGSEVAVFANSQSRFTSGASQVQATVSGGPVRVELPADLHPLTLEVDGRIWLRSLDNGVEIAVEPVERDGRTLRFVGPEAGGS